MPQMLAIQPTVPQASPNAQTSGTSGDTEQNRFSPHLDNAISSNKQQQQTATNKGRLTDEKSQSPDSQNSEDNEDFLQTAAVNDEAAGQEENLEQINLTPLHTETAGPTQERFAFSNPQRIDATAAPSQKALTALSNEMNRSGKLSNTYPVQSELPELVEATTEPLVLSTLKPVAAGKQDTLINQLQHIIDSAKESGTVSITKIGNGPAPTSINNPIPDITNPLFSGNSEPVNVTASAETSEQHGKGLFVAELDGIRPTEGKLRQQLTGIRHDNQQQYFTAKMNSQNLADNNQSFQGNQQGDEFSQQATSSGLPNGPFSAMEQPNTFSQISAAVQENTTQNLSESAKPILLPSGTMVHEEEILKQVAERFQISGKQMDSRINLKLHPVELGELKIDLTVKEGSIRANVVAQSQHTQEILEKNISKLKSMLENQGFTVDQIAITTESESVGDFDLFDRQFFSGNDYKPSVRKNQQEDEIAFTLEDNEHAASELTTGVNVKI